MNTQPHTLPPTPNEAIDVIRSPSDFGIEVDRGCWIAPTAWRASTGYGPYLAFYEASYGEIPAGMEVFHICKGGPRGCVRPKHLDIAPAGSKIRHVKDPAIEDEDANEFQRRMLDEQRARRATIPQFARELGVANSTLSDWLKGITVPSADTYEAIKRKLGWEGGDHKFGVLVIVERIVTAHSAGEAARAVIDDLIRDGQPEKVEIIDASVRA